MWRNKSPGVKILWLWTFGTAAVLVTNVARTRMKDMQDLINNSEQQQQQELEPTSSDEVIADQKS